MKVSQLEIETRPPIKCIHTYNVSPSLIRAVSPVLSLSCSLIYHEKENRGHMSDSKEILTCDRTFKEAKDHLRLGPHCHGSALLQSHNSR